MPATERKTLGEEVTASGEAINLRLQELHTCEPYVRKEKREQAGPNVYDK
jgi:hypothetical protein